MNPDPTLAWNVILILGIILNLGVAGMSLARSRQVQRREVSFAEAFASRGELIEIKSDVHRLQTRLDSHIDQLRSEIKSERLIQDEKNDKRSAALNTRINDVLEAVSELRGKLS